MCLKGTRLYEFLARMVGKSQANYSRKFLLTYDPRRSKAFIEELATAALSNSRSHVLNKRNSGLEEALVSASLIIERQSKHLQHASSIKQTRSLEHYSVGQESTATSLFQTGQDEDDWANFVDAVYDQKPKNSQANEEDPSSEQHAPTPQKASRVSCSESKKKTKAGQLSGVSL